MAGDAEISTQNMSFKDNAPGQKDTRGAVMDPTRELGFVHDADLNNFFSRPVRIFQTEWTVDTGLFARFNPWELFWENPRNAEKIRNYFLLKCTLHLKLVVNGNAFYFGRAILGYEPLAPLDNFSYSRYRSFVSEDVVRLSQRMKVFVNPTESQGGSLELPFFWPRNAWVIPDNEWREMGECVLSSIGVLRHANGGTNPVTISIFAWAENVSYAIPTGFVPEMGVPEMGDEHNENVISRPASNVARYAGALANVPGIGPFAKATEIGAGAIASIAKIFGYSSPTNLDYSVMVPSPRSSLAVVDTKYPTNKLSVDSKQEITLDPATTGIAPTDELPIASIAGRESFLTSFNWLQSDTIDQTLFQIYVDPEQTRYNGVERHLTACAAAVLPFDYWRGTMRFRFQIVASNYHRGRIRLVYDPKGGVIDPEYNTHYTTIHDIATEKDFTVDIGWAQPEPFRKSIGNRIGYSTSAITPLPPLTGQANGVLSVHVLNELTVPGTVVSDIQINVFVSMLDDFEVAMPAAELFRWRFRNPTAPQMGTPEMGVPEMAEGADSTDMDCCSDQITDPPTIDTMADAFMDSTDTTKLFFGEVIGSFRQMIKRTCLSEVHVANDASTAAHLWIRRRSFPEYGGRLRDDALVSPGSMVQVYEDGRKYVITSTTYLNYVAQMFLGWRGSVRWTFDMSAFNTSFGTDAFNSVTAIVSRDSTSPRNSNVTVIREPTQPLKNTAIRFLQRTDARVLQGAVIGNTKVNPILSVEVPFYSDKRFELTQSQPGFDGIVEEPSWDFGVLLPTSTDGTDIVIMPAFCSAGEDLNFFFFNGLPPIFFQPDWPIDSF